MFQPGVTRTPAETISIIEQQFKNSCLGVQEPIDTLQTATGVKDKIALFWINQLVAKAREAQQIRITNVATQDNRLRGRTTAAEKESVRVEIRREIQTELLDWVVTQPPEAYLRLAADSRA